MTVHLSVRGILRPLILAAVTFLCLQCAEIQPPSGGPVDTRPPQPLGAEPADGTLNYTGAPVITFQFDEYPDDRTLSSALIVVPRPIKSPKITAQGKRVVVQLSDSLRAATTYLVMLDANLKDLHGNALAIPAAVRFSTGSSIDTGSIRGRVLAEGAPLSGAVVAAYPVRQDSMVGDTLRPVYRGLTNTKGEYELSVLPAGEYAVVAFVDADRNERPDQDREQVGVADRMLTISPEQQELRTDIWMPPAGSALRPTAIQVGPELVRIRGLNRPTDSLHGEVHGPDGSSVAVRLSPQGDGRDLIAWLHVAESASVSLTLWHDADTLSLPIVMRPMIDSRPPEIDPQLPFGGWDTLTLKSVDLRSDEPLDTTMSLSLHGTGGDSALTLEAQWIDHFTLRLDLTGRNTSSPLQWGLPHPADMAGNILRDSIMPLPFTLISPDSLGSLSGTVLDLPESECWLVAREIQTRISGRVRCTQHRFQLRLPAGHYTLQSYCERGKTTDERWTPGSIQPLRYAEPRVTYRDTVAIRARFEISGVVLRPDIGIRSESKRRPENGGKP